MTKNMNMNMYSCPVNDGPIKNDCDQSVAVSSSEKLFHQQLDYLTSVNEVLKDEIYRLVRIKETLIGPSPKEEGDVDAVAGIDPVSWSDSLHKEICVLEFRVRYIRDVLDSLDKVI